MAQATFDPAQHLSTIKGQDYLEVKWRLAWLRSEQPDAVISTLLVSHDNDRAIFSAKVDLPNGGSATGWGSETAGSFGNYIEKAETKAIGRALAALGFGTQFCMDFDDGPETGVLADAPVQLRRTNQRPAQQDQRAPTSDPMSSAQKGKIQFMVHTLGMTPADLEQLAVAVTGSSYATLEKRQASNLIDALTAREQEVGAQRAS